MDYENLCKKCYMKKHKLSRKNLNHIVFTPYMEECDCCHQVTTLVDYIEEDEE